MSTVSLLSHSTPTFHRHFLLCLLGYVLEPQAAYQLITATLKHIEFPVAFARLPSHAGAAWDTPPETQNRQAMGSACVRPKIASHISLLPNPADGTGSRAELARQDHLGLNKLCGAIPTYPATPPPPA